MTGDLYEEFDLAELAAEVAREKPNGEKNALRKTYKGHIKRLGVAGQFDVQKKKEDAPSDFLAMMQVPDLEWSVHQVKGREIGDGLSEATTASLARAMTLSKGPIARSVWDTSVLGDMAPKNVGDASKPATAPARPTAPNTPAATTPSAGAAADRPRGPLAPGTDPLRPRRNIKKRTYGDSSYEGYGEGFPDDDGGADTGYSTGEGEGGQKRRKKVSLLSIHPQTKDGSISNQRIRAREPLLHTRPYGSTATVPAWSEHRAHFHFCFLSSCSAYAFAFHPFSDALTTRKNMGDARQGHMNLFTAVLLSLFLYFHDKTRGS